jgi:hypothetical protein
MGLPIEHIAKIGREFPHSHVLTLAARRERTALSRASALLGLSQIPRRL